METGFGLLPVDMHFQVLPNQGLVLKLFSFLSLAG